MTAQPSALQRVLSRDRWIVAACLAGLCLAAWLWLGREAGLLLAPGSSSHPAGAGTMDGMAMAGMAAPRATAMTTLAANGAKAFVMWFLMMVAMMLPSAAPMVLLYAAFARQARAQGAVLAPTVAFLGVYILLWAAFSLAAATVQMLLVRAGLVSAMTLRLGVRPIAGGVLALAGAYQLTPFKRACLAQCRSPLAFVTRYWRPGWTGAVRLGLFHGAYCIGCCWLLMALLFVGGVMNLAWVAVLAAIVLFEKLAPIGERGARTLGLAAIAAGLALAFWP